MHGQLARLMTRGGLRIALLTSPILAALIAARVVWLGVATGSGTASSGKQQKLMRSKIVAALLSILRGRAAKPHRCNVFHDLQLSIEYFSATTVQHCAGSLMSTTRSRVNIFMNKFGQLGFIGMRRRHDGAQRLVERRAGMKRCGFEHVDIRSLLWYGLFDRYAAPDAPTLDTTTRHQMDRIACSGCRAMKLGDAMPARASGP